VPIRYIAAALVQKCFGRNRRTRQSACSGERLGCDFVSKRATFFWAHDYKRSYNPLDIAWLRWWRSARMTSIGKRFVELAFATSRAIRVSSSDWTSNWQATLQIGVGNGIVAGGHSRVPFLHKAM